MPRRCREHLSGGPGSIAAGRRVLLHHGDDCVTVPAFNLHVVRQAADQIYTSLADLAGIGEVGMDELETWTVIPDCNRKPVGLRHEDHMDMRRVRFETVTPMLDGVRKRLGHGYLHFLYLEHGERRAGGDFLKIFAHYTRLPGNSGILSGRSPEPIESIKKPSGLDERVVSSYAPSIGDERMNALSLEQEASREGAGPVATQGNAHWEVHIEH